MLFTVYRVTNTVNGHFYVGKHQTKKADDRYLGSGKLIRQAVSKYGREAFTKEILFVFDNPEAMAAKEREIITEEFCRREDTYNLNVGGEGGWFHANQVSDHKTFLGKHHTPAFKAQMGSLVWLRRGAEVVRVPKDHLAAYLADGWERGRAKVISQGMTGNRSTTGRVWIHKPGDKAKNVPREHLAEHLSAGWALGRKPPSAGWPGDRLRVCLRMSNQPSWCGSLVYDIPAEVGQPLIYDTYNPLHKVEPTAHYATPEGLIQVAEPRWTAVLAFQREPTQRELLVFALAFRRKLGHYPYSVVVAGKESLGFGVLLMGEHSAPSTRIEVSRSMPKP